MSLWDTKPRMVVGAGSMYSLAALFRFPPLGAHHHDLRVLYHWRNTQVTHGKKAKRRGSKPGYGPAEQSVIVAIWKHSEQSCGPRLKQTLPLRIDSYQAHHGTLEAYTRWKILSYSRRTFDSITAHHCGAGSGRLGRKTGRASNWIKKFVPIRCGPQTFDEPGWFEAGSPRHALRPALSLCQSQRRNQSATCATLDPMDLAADIEARLGKVFTIVECIEEDLQDEMDRAGESRPQRKILSKPPQRTKTNSSTGCHEPWLNDSLPPVSFIIGAISAPNLTAACSSKASAGPTDMQAR